MIKKIGVLISISFLCISCGSLLGSVTGISTANDKKVAKNVINKNINEIVFDKLKMTNTFKTYIGSKKGQEYFEKIRTEKGNLEKLRFRAVIHSTSDTLINVFTGYFDKIDKKSKVEVFNIKEKGIVDIKVYSMWEGH